MQARKRVLLTLVVGVGLILGTIAALGTSYAGDNGRSDLSRAAVGQIEDLSTAIRGVAQQVRPSVVSIRTKKIPDALKEPGPEEPEPDTPADPEDKDMEELRERLRRYFERDFDFFERRNPPQPRHPRPRVRTGLGSGVIIDAEKGHILTNFHVIHGADEIQVKLHNGYRYQAREVGHDARADLAIIKIEADGLQEARLGSSDEAKTGDIVLAVGSPWGLEQTVTQGIISAKGRSIGSLVGSRISDADYIQTDAAVNPGNSGGPLVDIHGRVIGINVAIRPGTFGASYAGVVFAIPIDHAKKIMEHIISGEPLKRGWLGVGIADLADLDWELTKQLGVKHRPGIMVSQVSSDQPADRGGLQAGDVILEVDGEAVIDTASLQRAIAIRSPGSRVVLTILREKTTEKLRVELGEQPESLRTFAVRGEKPAEATIREMGVKVTELAEKQAKEIGVPPGTKGLLITEVARGSQAAELGLEANDVITEVQQKKVHTLEDLRRALANLSRGRGVSVTVVNRRGSKFFYFNWRR